MALTIAITPSGGSTITFGELGWTMASGVGRYAMDIDAGSDILDHRRFRPPGVNGSLLIRCGKIARIATVKVRYVGETIALAEAAYRADAKLIQDTVCKIVYSSQTLEGYNLLPNSHARVNVVRNTGYPVSGNMTMVFFDVGMKFQKDDYSTGDT